MLGVFKRRWKPKRSAANNVTRIPVDSAANPLDCAVINSDNNKRPASVRQVHPAEDTKKAHHLLGGGLVMLDDSNNVDLINGSPPPYPKRASLDSNPSPTQYYPLAPNICVEAGRIQFIKQQDASSPPSSAMPSSEGGVPDSMPTPPATPRISSRVTVTRGQQTELGDESFEAVKKSLEHRIHELELSLETVHKNELRDKQTIAKLQKQIARRESAQRDADRERRLRADSESRAKQALQEAARCRSRLKLLTTEFARMEETVRSMLVYKKQAEQLRQEKNALTLAFENRCQQYQSTITLLNNEISTLRQQLSQVGDDDDDNTLSTCYNPEEILQAHAAAIQRQAEESRKQYERCLDDVANQVVRALLTQKGLREEVGTLNGRINELETQNRALTSMLVHQLRCGSAAGGSDSAASPVETTAELISPPLVLVQKNNNVEDGGGNNVKRSEEETEELLQDLDEALLTLPSSTHQQIVKHNNSFNSESLDYSPGEEEFAKLERRLSANSDVLETRLSLEDKKRHQVLTKLWTELKGSEVTPKKLLEALSGVDSALWVQPQRPVSLNLHLPIVQATKYRRTRPILAQSSSKSEEETTGNESPESGNRDEGYSTMSSDVQTDLTRSSNNNNNNSSISNNGTVNTISSSDTNTRAGLEDLKEATDETDVATTTATTTTTTETRLLVTDNKDPEIVYIPFNLLNLKPRNSFPPGKDMLPFQHIMRSFSDSHLCIKITTAPSPSCYSFSSPISSSPSIFLLDITDSKNPLRRTKATSTLWDCDNKSAASPLSSWSPMDDGRAWDTEYIQQWLRLDETRSALQQQHRDMLELEYDRAELEDWSLSLSSDDLLREQQQQQFKAMTPGQISLSTTLPSIQENNALELEEDANECLWNNSSYMMDREGREIMTLLMDQTCNIDHQWPYAVSSMLNQQIQQQQNQQQQQNSSLQISPDNSWSSGGSELDTCSKRSSAALSGCSDDTNELQAIGTDFTRDFYRLVKFESTKSLASTSSRSLCDGGEHHHQHNNHHCETTTLHNVLNFIAEQQKYVSARENDLRTCSANDITKEFNIEGPPPAHSISDDIVIASDHDDVDENYVTLKQLCEEYSMNEQNNSLIKKGEGEQTTGESEIKHADEVCLVMPLDVVESENCSNITERPVDICSSVNVEINSTDYQASVLQQQQENKAKCDEDDKDKRSLSKSLMYSSSSTPSDSLTTSSVSSTPETIIVSKIPRRKQTTSTSSNSNNNSPLKKHNNIDESKIPKSRIPAKSTTTKKLSIQGQKEKIIEMKQTPSPIQHHVITSERLPQCSSGLISNIIDGPPHRAVSFHERATSKDVIDELNRMIKNENNPASTTCHASSVAAHHETASAKLDEGCKPTGWVHVEKDIDLTDPKARANLLDVMMASVSSDSSPTSSCGGSVASDSQEDPPDYGHLHRIHRFHRQKKANAARPELAVVRASMASARPTIIGRPDFFVRYGEKEMEAVASFDFLDEFVSTSTTANSLVNCSIDANDGDAEFVPNANKKSSNGMMKMKVTQV